MDRPNQPDHLGAHRIAGDGDETNRRVVFLHGFTQNAACTGPIGTGLAADNEVIAVDLPGHGNSVGFADSDLWRSAELVAHTTGPASYIGYSMGGRVGLHLALRSPDHVHGLVLIGATAGIEDDSERADRSAADRRTASRIEELGTPAFVREWLNQPLFQTLPEAGRFIEERSRNDAAALAQSLRNAGTGSMQPLWDRLEKIRCPVLVISGALDPKFTALARRIAESIGVNATAVVVPESGHSVHLEQPERCLELIREFLARLPPTPVSPA